MSTVRAESFLSRIGNDVCCPFFDNQGLLHVILQDAGEIIMIDSAGRVKRIHSTSGQPSGAVFDSAGTLYVSDFAHGAVLAVQRNGEQDIVVEVYEDKPLKGPNSITMDSKGTVFFTDSGPLGETGLHSPVGSLYMITNSLSGKILKPITLGTLAYPSGIALSPDGKFIYLAEMMTNRVLRFFQRPAGVYHGSVFYQLSGGVGPSCIVCDSSGTLYVGLFDVKEAATQGRVLVLSPTGSLLSTILTPGAEISGLAIKDNMLYITEKSSGSILRVEL